MKSLCLLVIVVAACVASSSALRCYDCYDSYGKKCPNPGPDMETKECPTPDYSKARAVCQKYTTTVGTIVSVTRACSATSSLIDPCDVMKHSATECSLCETDLCNGSGLVKVGVSILVPVAMAIAHIFNCMGLLKFQ